MFLAYEEMSVKTYVKWLDDSKKSSLFSVPIIPEFLYHVRHRYDYLTTTTTPPTV